MASIYWPIYFVCGCVIVLYVHYVLISACNRLHARCSIPTNIQLYKIGFRHLIDIYLLCGYTYVSVWLRFLRSFDAILVGAPIQIDMLLWQCHNIGNIFNFSELFKPWKVLCHGIPFIFYAHDFACGCLTINRSNSINFQQWWQIFCLLFTNLHMHFGIHHFSFLNTFWF